jgi:GT2 family glycosyltransferase/glycosyltransferase involved in cell wall biosynthesis
LSPASPPDARAPLLLRYGDASRSDPRAVPAGAEIVDCATTDPLEALRDPRAAGRDVVLLAHGTPLPAHAWERLLQAAAATPEIDVLSPMTAGIARDAACWAVSDRRVVPATAWCREFSYWRAARRTDALGTLDHLSIDGHGAVLDDVLRRARALAASPAYFGLDGKPVVMHVLHGWGGGAQRFVQDLAQGDDERHHLVLVAHGTPQGKRHGETLALYADLAQAPLREWPLAAPIAATALRAPEYRAHFETVLRDFGVGAVLVSSLIGHSLDALRSGLPTAVVTHDYYPLWPRLHADFGDAATDFSPAAIDAALREAGEGFEFAERNAERWRELRAAYLEALAQSQARLIAPSRGVMENLQRIEPALRERPWTRIEHGLAPWLGTPPRIEPDPARRTLRIVVPGRIHGGKGETLLAQLLPRLPEGVELVLLGAGAAAMRFFGRRAVHVGLDYRRDELPARLAQLKPDAVLLASTVAETWSYLLSEVWSLGLPVLATRLGSFAERIEHERTGLLFEPEAKALAALLARLRDERAPLDALRRATLPPARSVQAMAQDYRAALPVAAPRGFAVTLRSDARAARIEQAAHETRQALSQAEQRLAQQKADLDRRAEWAQAQERLARERTAWAQSVQAESERVAALNRQLDREVHARGAWAQSLIADVERLQELVVSEQRRLEAEVERERAHLVIERERNELILRSASWRLTRPLRVARRAAAALPVRLGFQLRRARGLASRLKRSMMTRGVLGTLQRVRQEFRPKQPPIEFVLPGQEDAALPELRAVEAPRASIVVPVYNHFHHTRTCLQALAACTDAAPFEVIVVDDGSSDETQERLQSLEGLRYVRNPRNLGFIGACNAGAAQARGEFLIFLNNDTAAQPGWIDALLRTFDEHERVGLAGAKLVYPDGRLQEAGGIVFSDASGWNYGRFDDPADPRYNYVREVDYCSGAAIAIRKPLFDGFGGFDSHYAPAYYEDTDLAMKVRAAGLRVLYQPASTVVHFEGVTSGTDTAGTGTKRFQVINQQKFLERWRAVLATHPAPGTDIAIAREHRAKKRVLMIDATTPQPDHDSGSLRLVNCMRVLKSEGHAVAFFADNRAWIEKYTADLQQLGIEVLWHPFMGDPVRWFRDNGARFDLVFISRHYVASTYLGLVRLHAPQARLVFDTVDLHYLREQREAELTGRPDLMHAADLTRTRELALIRSSDITLVVSPVERELLQQETPGARVEIVSNVHEVFGRRREYAQRAGLVFMGGFAHPPNADAVTWFVREVLPQVRRDLPDIVFHIVGSKPGPEVLALSQEPGVAVEGFVEDIAPFMDGCRVAVAPLRYGAGVKGKVNMSMSYGQPVVATPIAIEGMHAQAGRDVLVAADAEGFAREVVRAYTDESLWRMLSDNGIENVRRHFSFEAARAAVRRLFD